MTSPKNGKPRLLRATTRCQPRLRFSPTAWAKLLYLRESGPTEVGGFGITPADDLLLVEDIRLVGQRSTSVSVVFDDTAVADFFEEQVDRGLRPEQFGRIWVHTHPGSSAEPSMVDEETFARAFGRADWAVMLILAEGGRTYARLRFNAGPGGDLTLPVSVDFDVPFAGSDPEAWQAEYQACVRPDLGAAEGASPFGGPLSDEELELLEAEADWLAAFEQYEDELSEPSTGRRSDAR